MAKQTGSPRKPGKRGKTRSKFKKKSKKISVNDIMQEFENKDKVQVVIDSSFHAGLPDKGFHGLTGYVCGKRGRSFEVKLNKGNKEMMVVTTAVHLKKLKWLKMSKDNVVSMEPVSLYEVKTILKERKAIKELNYEQDLAMKYVDKFAKLTEKQTEDLIKDLGAIEFLKEEKALLYGILAVLPTRLEQLQLLIPKAITPTDEELKAVVELTQKYADKVE